MSDKKEFVISVFLISASFITNIYINMVVAGVMIVYYVIRYRQIRLDWGDPLIFLGMFTWYLIGGYGLFHAIACGVWFLLLYQFGKIISLSYKGDQTDSAGTISVSIATVLFLKGLIEYSGLVYDRKAYTTEIWPDWSGTLIPRTQHEFYITVIAALLGYFVLLAARRLMIGMVYALLSCIAVIIAVKVEGRVAFFVCLCVTAVTLTAYLIENRLYEKKPVKVMIYIVVLTVTVVAVAFCLDLFGLYTAYRGSMWAGSGGIIHNTRFALMWESLKMLKDYPFGAGDVPLVESTGRITVFAHNSWVEVAREGGIIPFVLTVAFTVTNCLCIISIWMKNKNFNKYAVISVYIALSMYHFIEPGILANMLFWGVYIFISGSVRAMYNDASTSNRDLPVGMIKVCY